MTPETSALVIEHRDYARRYALKLARVCAVQEYADDCVSEAMVGLLEAARRFDPERGLRFGTYAKFWIRNRVLLFIAHNKYALRQTNTHRVTALAIRMTRIVTRLAGEIGHEPDAHEYAAALGVSVEDIEQACLSMRRRDMAATSTDDRSDGSHVPEGHETPEDRYAETEERHAQSEAIEEALAGLSERDADIMRRRLMGDAILEELAQAHGVTRERVRQIQAEHTPMLRRRLLAWEGAA